MEFEEIRKIFLKAEISPLVLGQDDVKRQVKSALVSGRHMIIVGPPGVGKTTLAKDIATHLPEAKESYNVFDLISVDDRFSKSDKNKNSKFSNKNEASGSLVRKELDSSDSKSKSSKLNSNHKISSSSRFIRVQGSPDLTAEDLIGDIDPINAMKYGPLSVEAFTPGKIFKAHNGILFFDEVNRCSEKLQNSLLQVLEEGKATVGSYEVDFKADFIFIGTMNPKDFSTENLSDVFLDRFDLINMHYPENLEIEKQIVLDKSKILLNMSNKQNKKLLHIIVAYVRSLRNSSKLEKFPSVRATIGVFERSQANALIDGRVKMIAQDFKEALESVLSHRIKLKPSVKYLQSPNEVLDEELKSFTKANNIDMESLSSEDSSETPDDASGEYG